MARSSLEVDFDPIMDHRPYTKNMFTKVLGDKYAKAFHEVYYAGINDRDEKMMDLYDESKKDGSLDDTKKRIIAGCYLAYREATGARNISMPLVSYVEIHKPVLSKGFKNNTRFKRTIEGVFDIFDSTGFDFDVTYVLDLIRAFNIQTGYASSDDRVEELILCSALNKFFHACSPTSYANKWYAAYYLRNIGLLAYTPPKAMKEDPDLKTKIQNIAKTNRLINLLEFKRAGIFDKKETDESKAKKEKINEHYNNLAKDAKDEQEAIGIEVGRGIAELCVDLNQDSAIDKSILESHSQIPKEAN